LIPKFIFLNGIDKLPLFSILYHKTLSLLLNCKNINVKFLQFSQKRSPYCRSVKPSGVVNLSSTDFLLWGKNMDSSLKD